MLKNCTSKGNGEYEGELPSAALIAKQEEASSKEVEAAAIREAARGKRAPDNYVSSRLHLKRVHAYNVSQLGKGPQIFEFGGISASRDHGTGVAIGSKSNLG